uniref:GLOBIN domain-containing protein n=1 Tax=Rhabditophanes sp. KR3021 TaxID=114890 RepID=A0AC35U4Q7_9BILA
MNCSAKNSNNNSSSSSGVTRSAGGSGKCRSRSNRNRENVSTLGKMTASQKSVLISSWKFIKPNANFIMRKIFTELESVSPKVKQIFAKAAILDCFSKESSDAKACTVDEHVRLLSRFIDDVISNIDKEKEVRNILRKVGQSHAGLSNGSLFTSSLWEFLGEIAVAKICQVDYVQKSREAAKAWRLLIAFMTDELRNAFDEQVKIVRRSSVDFSKESTETDITEKLKNIHLEYQDSSHSDT